MQARIPSKIIARRRALFALAAAAAAPWVGNSQAQNSSVSYTGQAYTQNFNSLPYTPGTDVNTANPVTLGAGGTTYTFNNAAYSSNASAAGTFDFAAPIDTSGTPTATGTGGFGLMSTMPGWYGGGVTAIKAGAQSGSQTTGGILSFGTTGGINDANRALGLLATSTTGVTFFGLKLINNSGATINAINLGFTGELWRQQTVAKALNYGYFVDATTSDSVPLTSTSLGSISFATGASTGTTVNTTGPLLSTAVSQNNVTLATPWTAGSALWLVFQEASNTGGSQGIGIDDFSFSSPAAGVPEPGVGHLAALGILGLGAMALRRRQAAQA